MLTVVLIVVDGLMTMCVFGAVLTFVWTIAVGFTTVLEVGAEELWCEHWR